jgi:hypothetical protein
MPLLLARLPSTLYFQIRGSHHGLVASSPYLATLLGEVWYGIGCSLKLLVPLKGSVYFLPARPVAQIIFPEITHRFTPRGGAMVDEAQKAS